MMAPTWVSSLRSLKPLRDVPVSSHIASACADITSLTHASTSGRATAPRPPSAIAPSNCRIVSIAVSVSVESFSWSNQILGRGPRFFQSALTPLFATRSRDGIGYHRIPGSRTPGRLASVRALHQLSRHYQWIAVPISQAPS